jgi:hypothetical protein
MWTCSSTEFESARERRFVLGFNLGIVGDVHESAGCAVRAVRSAAVSGRQ